jgi:hypothetical protein
MKAGPSAKAGTACTARPAAMWATRGANGLARRVSQPGIAGFDAVEKSVSSGMDGPFLPMSRWRAARILPASRQRFDTVQIVA